MAKQLFDTSSWKWDGWYYPEPWNTEEPEAAPPSKYSAATGTPAKLLAPAKLNAYALRAMFGIEDALRPEHPFGFGFARMSSGVWLTVVPNGAASNSFATGGSWFPGQKYAASYNPVNGKVATAIITEEGELKNSPDHPDARIAIMMAAMLHAITTDEEAEELWSKIADEGTKDSSELTRLTCVLSDNLYRRVTQPSLPEEVQVKVNMDSIGNITESMLSRMNVLYGTDAITALFPKPFALTSSVDGAAVVSTPEKEEAESETEEEKAKTRPETIAELKGFYSLYPYRVLSPEEEALVPTVPETYQITDQIVEICEMMKKSTDMPTPMRNFMFVGGAGSGKTEAVKMIAYALGLPLLHQPCGVDTEKFDIAQQVIPDGNGGFKYVNGPMIEACKKGYVCEISEADLILKQGTLGEFNPLLDKTGTYPLSTGEIVKRHPDTVLIFTMNADYEGCRNINQAVRNRCQVFQFDTPSDEVLIKRVSDESGYKDIKAIGKMVDVYHRIRDYCETNAVTDGAIGVRNLIAWATATAINNRPYHNAFSCMVLGATFDKEVHGDLMRCVEAQFVPEEVIVP